MEDYYKINRELKLYSEKIARRPQILAANKMDLPGAEENYKRLEELAAKEHIPIFAISAATKQGLKELIDYTAKALDEYVEEPEEEEGVKVYDAKDEDKDVVKITRNDSGDFIVSSKALDKLVAMIVPGSFPMTGCWRRPVSVIFPMGRWNRQCRCFCTLL